MNNPQPLTSEDWLDIFALQEVQDAWGLEPDDTFESLVNMTYAVKYDYVNGSPGYVGPMYILMGNGLAAPPMVLIRPNNMGAEDGGLHIIQDHEY